MGEGIKKLFRRFKKQTQQILEDENFYVAEATGKLAEYFDFNCFDRGCWKHVKIFYKDVDKDVLDKLLAFDKSPFGSKNNTILQFFIWEKYGRKPLARPKCEYNNPGQDLPADLEKFVK